MKRVEAAVNSLNSFHQNNTRFCLRALLSRNWRHVCPQRLSMLKGIFLPLALCLNPGYRRGRRLRRQRQKTPERTKSCSITFSYEFITLNILTGLIHLLVISDLCVVLRGRRGVPLGPGPLLEAERAQGAHLPARFGPKTGKSGSRFGRPKRDLWWKSVFSRSLSLRFRVEAFEGTSDGVGTGAGIAGSPGPELWRKNRRWRCFRL